VGFFPLGPKERGTERRGKREEKERISTYRQYVSNEHGKERSEEEFRADDEREGGEAEAEEEEGGIESGRGYGRKGKEMRGRRTR